VGNGKGPLIAIEGRVIRTEKHVDGYSVWLSKFTRHPLLIRRMIFYFWNRFFHYGGDNP